LDGQPSLFFEWLAEVRVRSVLSFVGSMVAVASFFPCRAKDLSARPRMVTVLTKRRSVVEEFRLFQSEAVSM